MNRSTALTSIALLLSLALCRGQVDQVDALIEKQMQTAHVPGISVGVVRNGHAILAKGYGFANLEHGVKATADTVYEILSVTKPFTAAAVCLLIEQGKLRLDDLITKYLPDSPAAWNQVTVRYLLTHTSGIEDFTDIPPFFEQLPMDATPEDLLRPAKQRPLQFKPGSQWRYSNSNYYLLGLIIEKVSGQTYEQFLEDRIFRPLEMRSTRLVDYRDVISNRAAGYNWIGEDAEKIPAFISGFHGIKNVLQNALYISPTRKWAAGAIMSTVNDLIKWEIALDTGGLF